MTFHVGMKVVCVDAEPMAIPPPGAVWDGRLEQGAIYTIRWAGNYYHRYLREHVYCVRLVGVARRIIEKDAPFDAKRFRPIIERKTDISLFTGPREKVTP